MNPLSNPGKLLVITGLAIAAIGILMVLGPKIPFFGKLPGDILIKRENFRFYFPITTCIIVSMILTLVYYLFRR